ncbi:MAG: 2-oxo acid dehydrogenase subunit E2 [Chloroflexi bacterium]|nr:2-oxo acid dehydrogenase subunit E2 [Chloroflexota bacterium]MBT3862503.1 2-oxo acid dehydrogenase subunit E2 [Chloroflexota bacterium]MBT4943839.1 2-oxo acid dehydrogenase subunit E2 [Chloroflexota bacterium]MBT5252270.1 2-oxo acid dehydrogenase subunit E2 [Chloroflexota bacterium]MBT5892383.1 2-oxo acid dehydrogenase subunit E2 [Chloroflexota bacterium]
MISEVTMPSMGADMTEGTIAKWLKAEGDSISRGDKIAEIETDKTVVEMEAYAEGLLRKIVVPEGTLVQVGTIIAFIGDPGDDIPDIPEADPAAEAPKVEATGAASTPAPVQQAAPTPALAPVAVAPGGRVKASPIARKLAEEKGFDISSITGTGPGGRITKTDVENFTPSPAFAASGGRAPVIMDGSDTPLSSMRQAIARVTVKSKTESPHYYVTHEVNMGPAMTFRAQLNEALVDDGERVSVNDMVLRAVTIALLKHPKWNSSFDGDKLIGHSEINLGVAIALEEGLIVPAVVGIHNMSLIEISRAVRDLGNRARGEGGSLTQAEMTSGTFGTSNLGMFGTDTFAAIIVPPNAGIIAVGAVKEKPIVKDGQIVIGKTMQATISADHRVGDGAEAAILMGEFQKALENPARLML